MPNQPRLKVIKVPLEYEPSFKSINFPPMPRLYLEFFENKNKVKPELRNKEYIPKLTTNSSINLPSLQDATDYAQKQDDTLASNVDEVKSRSRERVSPKSSREGEKNVDNKVTNGNIGNTKKLQILDISKMSENDIQELTEKRKAERRENLFRYKKLSSNRIESENNNVSDDDIGYREQTDSKKESSKTDDENTVNVENTISLNQDETSKPIQDDEEKVDKNLLNILKGNKIESPSVSTNNVSATNFTTNNQSRPVSSSIPNLPPSISEINSGKVINTGYRDLTNTVVNNDDDITRKRKILSDFKRIKKMDPVATIPEFTELTDLNTLEREYANVVRNLHIDSNVENYKKWLTMGFIGLEWVLSNWMKFEEIKGFSAAQMTSMNQYERILIEIGEKSYVPEEKRLAPEIRLIGIIMMNAATFIGMKMLFKSTGMNMSSESSNSSSSVGDSGLGGLFANLSSMGGGGNTSNKPKRKMPGPDIDLNDLNFKKNE
jgi:hypothetical protein